MSDATSQSEESGEGGRLPGPESPAGGAGQKQMRSPDGDPRREKRRLRQILSAQETGPSQKIQALLQVGADRLGVENGHLVRIDPADGEHRIVETSGPHPAVEKGATTDLAGTYCRKLLAGRDALAVENAPEQGWEGDPAYEAYGLATYIGAKVVVEGQLYGTVCFVDSEPRSEPIGEAEEDFLELLSGAIVRELGRRGRQERIRRSEARLGALFAESPDMVTVHDAEGTLMDVNPRLLKKTGYDREELLGKKVWDLEQGLGPEEALGRLEEMAPGERQTFEDRYRRKDGATFPVEVHLRRLRREGDGRFMTITRDISDRKESEQRLRRQNDLFRKAEELADIGAWEYDPDAGRLRWTDQVYEIYGFPKDTELTTDRAIGAFHPDDRPVIEEAFGRAVKEGVPYDLEVRLQTAEGETRWVRAHGDVQTEDGETVRVLGTIQDITDRKQREEALEEAKEEAEKASRLKSAMLANMNHEIRTPLTSVTGFAEIMHEELGGQMREFAGRIHKSGERLMRTLDSVLEFSKLEAGVFEIEREEVDLVGLTRETADVLRPSAAEKNISFEMELPDGAVWGQWNEGALNRVTENLIENAIKFTPDGGTVTVRILEEPGKAVLAVEDTGVGIGESAQEEIFEAFQQESEGLGREFEGSGLGLSIVKRLVTVHDGTVEVESEKGEGSRLVVRLPTAEQNS